MLGPLLRPLRPLVRRIEYGAPLLPGQVYGVHDLTMNHPLSREEHAHCVALSNEIQALYDDAPAYVTRNGLDPEIFLPGNEWASIVPASGLKFKTEYNHINLLRLHAPFAGFHMPVLDRLDAGGRFPKAEAEAFVTKLWVEGIPDDVAEQQRSRFDPLTRLRHVVPEYLEHIRNVPPRFIVQTPRMFGEIGLDVNGVLVHPDVILCQSRVNGLLCSGILEKLAQDIERCGRARILEVGAGYGALAYALKRIFGERLEYVVVDLPSSLWYAAIYLSTLAGGEGCTLLKTDESPPERFQYLFVANHLLERALPRLGPINVAINTMSFSEMTRKQNCYYGEVIRQLIGKDGVLFEENAAPSSHHVDNKAIFAEIFPYHRRVTSSVVTTKNWCQDVWANRYLGSIFDRSDTAAQ